MSIQTRRLYCMTAKNIFSAEIMVRVLWANTLRFICAKFRHYMKKKEKSYHLEGTCRWIDLKNAAKTFQVPNIGRYSYMDAIREREYVNRIICQRTPNTNFITIPLENVEKLENTKYRAMPLYVSYTNPWTLTGHFL